MTKVEKIDSLWNNQERFSDSFALIEMGAIALSYENVVQMRRIIGSVKHGSICNDWIVNRNQPGLHTVGICKLG